MTSEAFCGTFRVEEWYSRYGMGFDPALPVVEKFVWCLP